VVAQGDPGDAGGAQSVVHAAPSGGIAQIMRFLIGEERDPVRAGQPEEIADDL
jgi:hypothetical protein